jgi:hypothetical protein
MAFSWSSLPLSLSPFKFCLYDLLAINMFTLWFVTALDDNYLGKWIPLANKQHRPKPSNDNRAKNKPILIAKKCCIKITINNCRYTINMIYTVSNTSSFENFAIFFYYFLKSNYFLGGGGGGAKAIPAPLVKYCRGRAPTGSPASYAAGHYVVIRMVMLYIERILNLYH